MGNWKIRNVLLFTVMTAGADSCRPGAMNPDPEGRWLDRVRPERQQMVRKILEGDPLEVPLPRTMVQSRLDVYEYLLAELPFTASVVRALRSAEYEIFREEASVEDSKAQREQKSRTYYLDDHDGMELAAELVYHAPGIWVYYVWGKYSTLFTIRGNSVIVVTAKPRGTELETEGQVFVPIMKAARGLVSSVIRKKSSIFIDAARTVAEAAALDPQGLLRNVRGSPEVDEAQLRWFESKFLTP